jgi:hypothetical protein
MEFYTGRTSSKRKNLNRILMVIVLLWMITGLLCLVASKQAMEETSRPPATLAASQVHRLAQPKV